jgi:hypothetical protein
LIDQQALECVRYFGRSQKIFSCAEYFRLYPNRRGFFSSVDENAVPLTDICADFTIPMTEHEVNYGLRENIYK